MKLAIKKGTTSKLIQLFIQDASQSDGSGLSGLVYNAGSLSCAYYREGAASATAITLANMTTGTWVSGGLKSITNAPPGSYQLGVPDAALASGADAVNIWLWGASNMVVLPIEIELVEQDPQGIALARNKAFTGFPFTLRDAVGRLITGVTVSIAKRSIDGGSFSDLTNAPAEIGLGLYKVNLTAAETNGQQITYAFGGTGADTSLITVIPLP